MCASMPTSGPAERSAEPKSSSGCISGSLGDERQHRSFPLPDLVIAATAGRHGATVLHYDADFDRIAAVTGQPVEWVAPPGSL